MTTTLNPNLNRNRNLTLNPNMKPQTKPCTPASLNRDVLDRIWLERQNQMRLLRAGKFTFTCATSGIADDKKLRVITEELGEVAQAIDHIETIPHNAKSTDDFYKKRRAAEDHLEDELTQLAACCIAWLECMAVDKRRARHTR